MNRKQIVSLTLLSFIGFFSAPSWAEEDDQKGTLIIDSIDTQQTTIVSNDVAFTLGPNLTVRDADGKYLSPSSLRKGLRCEAITEGVAGRSRFVIKELNFCRQTR